MQHVEISVRPTFHVMFNLRASSAPPLIAHKPLPKSFANGSLVKRFSPVSLGQDHALYAVGSVSAASLRLRRTDGSIATTAILCPRRRATRIPQLLRADGLALRLSSIIAAS